MTIIGDIYSVAERAKVQGYVASVWAISAVVGPTLGGLFVDFLDWRWIFFVNVPLGAVAAWALIRRFHEQVERPVAPDRPRRRWPAGHRYLAADPRAARGRGALALGLGAEYRDSRDRPLPLLVVFVVVERRAAEPILPGWVFRSRLLNATNLAALAVGVMLIGLTSYVPLFAQGVLGTNALVAGFALAALTLGWPLAASVAGRIYLRIGFRNTALIGAAVILVGAALMVLLSTRSSIWQVAATCFVVGLGMGLTVSPTLIAAQSSVDWAATRGGDRDQHVRPLDGQRAGHRCLRCDRQCGADFSYRRACVIHRRRHRA